jgi:DNA polymerase-3 subunit beta
MKLTIAPGTLANAVAWAARTLPARPSVPVLAGLLIEVAADGNVAVSAFDYDMSATATIDADTVAEPGKILLPGRILAEVTKALPDRSMAELAATDSECTITCGRSDFTLRLMPVDDYPNLPEPPATVGTIDAAALAAAVNQVHPAVGRDDTLPMLTGIRLDTDGEQFTLAATDRYRIAVTDTTWQPVGDTTLNAVIPGRHLHDITKGIGHGPVTIGLNEAMAAFTTADRTTTLRLPENQFIDYRARTTLNPAHTATVDASTLAAAVKRVALVADRKTAGIRLHFTDGEVTVRAGGDDIGRGNETVGCELAGDPIEIAFQSTYLLDALGAIDGQARIGMTGPVKPALFTSQDGNHKQLAMSLRLA